MKLTKTNIDNFGTKLGEIYINLISNSKPKTTKSSSSIIIETDSYLIEVIAFNDIKKWMDNIYYVEKSIGWIIRLIKTNNSDEKISIECSLIPNDKKISSDIDSGEHLDSLFIENELEILNIGTEDGEMLKYRSENNDWMPSRFKNNLGYQSDSDFSFTNYLDFGFKTDLPKLNNGEKIYLHYLIATNNKEKISYNSDNRNISTWFAVDFPKKTLIEKLGLKNEITKC